MAQAQLWLKTLRQAVKGDYGPGWILKEQYDRFKIGRAAAARNTATLHHQPFLAPRESCGPCWAYPSS